MSATPSLPDPPPVTAATPERAPHPPLAPAIPATPTNDYRDPSSSAPLRPPELPPSPPISTITIPSYARWFSFESIHETERRFLSEFFAGPRSTSKNPRVYRYYRDSIIEKFRENPSRKITFTEVRRTLVGDVGSIRRVFDFLEGWGLINYMRAPSKPGSNSKGNEKDNASAGGGAGLDSQLEKKESSKKICGACKSVCILAGFACTKADLILCSRCYVRGNYQLGLNSGDFKRVEISEETKLGWTDKETIRLLEALLQFGDDWKKVAEHVGGRSEKDCVARFIKLPFGEQFVEPPNVDEIEQYYDTKGQLDSETAVNTSIESSPTKRRRLTPLADASNPIMAQAAFLSALVGSGVAEAAAHAAITALSEVNSNFQGAENSNGENFAGTLQAATLEAQSQLEKEEQELEQSIFTIIEHEMKEIQAKLKHFEDLETLMEKEWQQLHYMRSLLFADQLNILQHKAPLKFAERGEEKMKMKTLESIT